MASRRCCHETCTKQCESIQEELFQAVEEEAAALKANWETGSTGIVLSGLLLQSLSRSEAGPARASFYLKRRIRAGSLGRRSEAGDNRALGRPHGAPGAKVQTEWAVAVFLGGQGPEALQVSHFVA